MRSLDGPVTAAAPDWRFVLPLRAESRVLDLSGRDDVATSLEPDVAELAVAPPAGPWPDGPFDLVVLHDAMERVDAARADAAALLGRIRGRLATSGALWAASGRRSGAPGWGEWRRLLARAGFARQDAWALLPDLDHAREIVPLDSAAAWDFATAPRRGTWSPRPFALARGAFRLGLAGRIAPAFGIVAS